MGLENGFLQKTYLSTFEENRPEGEKENGGEEERGMEREIEEGPENEII